MGRNRIEELREKHREYMKKYRKKPEVRKKEKILKREWDRKNKEHVKKYSKKYREKNKERIKQLWKVWSNKNKEYLKQRKINNRERYRKYQKLYKQKYPEKIKAHNWNKKIYLKSNCKFCDSNKKLEHHHLDYSKPKSTITVCKKCHTKIHYRGDLWDKAR